MTVPQGKITNPFQRRYVALVERRDSALFERLKNIPTLRPAFTPAKAAAFLIAALIHGTTILLPLLGILMVLSNFAGCLSFCWCILFVALAWIVRPRFAKPPDNILSRAEFPLVYHFADEVAAHLEADPADALVVDEFFNAGYNRYGVHQSVVITIGYPLWMRLNPQERVALMAHELAHGVNGDFNRTGFVGGAMNTLIEWYLLLRPSTIFGSRNYLVGALANLLMLGLANSILGILFVLRQLLLYESRRAEYLADYLAAQVAGTDAALSLLEKFQGKRPPAVPLIQASHPPLARRIEFLRAQPFVASPSFVLSDARSGEIDREFARLQAEIDYRIQQRKRQGRYLYWQH
jgi:heat shock protein HtpX